MTWVLDLDPRPRSSVITLALCRAGRDMRLVDAPDVTDRTGVVVCSSSCGDLQRVLAISVANDAHVIVVSWPGSPLEPWSLLAAGATDHLVWNDDAAPVRARLDRVLEIERLVGSSHVAEVLQGVSPALRRALRDLVTAAHFGSGPILILGETGTGKELAAQVVHSVGPTAKTGSLVVVDCTTIVPTLSGSELFGHERGAFTGAVSVRTGACAAANGGTLLLDEVGDLPFELQPELLRVVQEGTYKRVGADSWQRTTFRLVCATNRALDEEVRAGRFRADFYHRIAASTVRLPPLRERVDDVIPLFQEFFSRASGRAGLVELTPTVRSALQRREYPGNLRELQQLARRVAARHVGVGPVTPGDLPPSDRPLLDEAAPRDVPADGTDAALLMSIRTKIGGGATLKQLREQVADLAVEAALEASGGNVRAAAAALGVTDRALHLRRAQRRGHDSTDGRQTVSSPGASSSAARSAKNGSRSSAASSR